MKKIGVIFLFWSFAACIAAAEPSCPGECRWVHPVRTHTGMAWVLGVPVESAELRVSTPSGEVVSRMFEGPATPMYDVGEQGGRFSAEGLYTWELRIEPAVPAGVRERLAEARNRNDREAISRIRLDAGLPLKSLTAAGHFTVRGGSVVPFDGVEERPSSADDKGEDDGRTEDQVIDDDLISTGNFCVGFDCADEESFGFDTIRMKEHNLRLAFMDTSYTAEYPSNDWLVGVNSVSNAGGDYFGIWDCGLDHTGSSECGNRVFTLEAGAPESALYVDDLGRVGIGTAVPEEKLHVNGGDTPALRLDQDATAGWEPHSWDVAGNEANFFVRDVSNGSKLGFRIETNTPGNSLCLKSSGNAGFGTWYPEAALEVERDDGTSKVLVEEKAPGASRELLELRNAGEVGLRLSNTAGDSWTLFNTAGGLQAGPDVADPLMVLDSEGNLNLDGILTQGSSRKIKKDLDPMDGNRVLGLLSDLPVYEWSYASEAGGTRHAGPMAEDFHERFGLGRDGKTLAPSDLAGVSLAAVQELRRNLEAKEERIARLEARNEQLEARLSALEAALEELRTLGRGSIEGEVRP